MQQNWKFRRGDIYYVQFGNTSTGSEQHGDRPAVIIQNDVGNTYAPTLIVVPLTSNTEKKVTQPTHCLLENEGLSMSSMALAEQIFLKGVMYFVEVYHGEFNEERLIRALRSVHPMEIYRTGMDNPAKLPGWKKYVFPIYAAYNGKSRKDALPMKF